MERITRPISLERVEEFISRHGRSANQTLSYLGKHSAFIDAHTTEIGAAILEDDVIRWHVLFDRIARIDASDEEKIEFKYLTSRIETISKRITKWMSEEKKLGA